MQANWKQNSQEAKGFSGRQRHSRTNKTGTAHVGVQLAHLAKGCSVAVEVTVRTAGIPRPLPPVALAALGASYVLVRPPGRYQLLRGRGRRSPSRPPARPPCNAGLTPLPLGGAELLGPRCPFRSAGKRGGGGGGTMNSRGGSALHARAVPIAAARRGSRTAARCAGRGGAAPSAGAPGSETCAPAGHCRGAGAEPGPVPPPAGDRGRAPAGGGAHRPGAALPRRSRTQARVAPLHGVSLARRRRRPRSAAGRRRRGAGRGVRGPQAAAAPLPPPSPM